MYQVPPAQFIPVKWDDGRLAFKFDPQRGLIEIQHRGEKRIFDLSEIVSQQVEIKPVVSVGV